MDETPLMLGVSGMRGIVGKSLTHTVVSRYAAAFGDWLKQHRTSHCPPRVMLGRDSRVSGPMLEHAAVAGLAAVGCRVTKLGVVTSPGVAIMVSQLGADGGLVITGSHNPMGWNGVKPLRCDGVAPPPVESRQIIDAFWSDTFQHAFVDGLAEIDCDDSTHSVHVGRIISQIDSAAIATRKLKVVLDSMHGAGGAATAVLMEELGVELIHLYGEPTGHFPHPPEPLREHLSELCAVVKSHGADVGFAQDTDADRLAIVDETGRYIGEEYSLALSYLHVMSRASRPSSRLVVTNLSTSRMVDDVAQRLDGHVIRTPVGEANVAQAMCRSGALIGGEGNGGVIWSPVAHVRDSLVGMGLVLEMLAMRSESLSAVVRSIPSYAIVKDKSAIIGDLVEHLNKILPKYYADQAVDLQDGVRVEWADRWIHVRPSNTEPIVRLIAEATNVNQARDLIGEVRGVLGI